MTLLRPFQWRHDTAARWAAVNPVLALAEAGAVDDSGSPLRWKLGDGVTRWLDLPFEGGGTTGVAAGPHTHVETDITDLSIGVPQVTATGAPSATTFLRGDGSWATPVAGGTTADGSVTTAKVADGAVTAAKVAADVATQAELDIEAAARLATPSALNVLLGTVWA